MAEGLEGLSPRHLEVLAMVADGLANKEIATTLRLADRTVKTYVEHILRTLDVPNRTAAGVLWSTAQARRETTEHASLPPPGPAE